MAHLAHDLIAEQAAHTPQAEALRRGDRGLTYEALATAVDACAASLVRWGLRPSERVGIYLPKCFEAVVAFFGTAAAGGVFVPINPVLKPRQVAHILRDCNVRVLITGEARLQSLHGVLAQCPDLENVIVVGECENCGYDGLPVMTWDVLLGGAASSRRHRRIDADMAAILYTSGSTGPPKGVVLSHRNLVVGAQSVAQYLENRADDRILAVLPFSFDAGLSQLTTGFVAGASVVLMEYLLPRDVVKTAARHGITGITAVPPLWTQLGSLSWPARAMRTLRYIATTGGSMPRQVTAALRAALPDTRIFLMYGLTEAFRSTYLRPEEVERRPDSIGKAIPNAEIMVVRENGSLCAPGEAGELVHRGALVALGYWNDPERTAERFRPAPAQLAGLTVPEMAVWSGDNVRRDEEGYLYFVGRNDEMIKCSGYRVSPTEVEEVLYGAGTVAEAVAVGVPHPTLGQGVVAVVRALPGGACDAEALLEACRRELPGYMVPLRVMVRDALPHTPNGKLDRRALAEELQVLFRAENLETDSDSIRHEDRE